MMWPYCHDSWTWIWMAGTMVVLWVALIPFAVWAIRALGRSRPGTDEELTTLRRRLASGEITPDEFENNRRMLQS